MKATIKSIEPDTFDISFSQKTMRIDTGSQMIILDQEQSLKLGDNFANTGYVTLPGAGAEIIAFKGGDALELLGYIKQYFIIKG